MAWSFIGLLNLVLAGVLIAEPLVPRFFKTWLPIKLTLIFFNATRFMNTDSLI